MRKRAFAPTRRPFFDSKPLNFNDGKNVAVIFLKGKKTITSLFNIFFVRGFRTGASGALSSENHNQNLTRAFAAMRGPSSLGRFERVQKFKSSRAQTLKHLEHLEPLKPFKNQLFINQLNQRKEKHYGKTHRYFT